MTPAVIRRRYAALLALLGIAIVAGCAAWTRSDETRTFTIVQLNDVYDVFPVSVEADGHTELRGGLAYAATMIREERRRGPTLVLHAGDLLGPSVLSTALKHRGAQMIEALNALGVDAATFGNHEFDDRCRVLAQRIHESRFLWLSANVAFPPEAELAADRVARRRIVVVQGLRVGLFGLSLPTSPVSGCGDGVITFHDPIKAAREAVDALTRDGADVIIAVTHLPMAVDRALAEALPAIDLIVGGHEHEPMDATIGRTLITKAGANAEALGVITVTVTKTRGKPEINARWTRRAVDPASVAPDSEMTRVLAPYARELEPFAAVIGRSAVPLDAREEVVREAESNLGDYVADAVREAMHADVALINGGAFRDDRLIPAGPLTLGDVHTVLPFVNQLVTVRVTGAELLAALENGVSLAGHKAGRFPQVSGVRFAFTPHAAPGHRVIHARVNDAPVEPERAYTLATTDFLIRKNTMDGYTFPENAQERGGLLTEVVLERIRTGSPIQPRVEGRIERVEAGPSTAPGSTRP